MFLCDYVIRNDESGRMLCSNCPLDWGEVGLCTYSGGHQGLYAAWDYENDYLKCAEVAKEIANLKEKEIQDVDKKRL